MYTTDIQSGLDCSVLVLNRNYMAIRIVGVKRALSLLFRQLAEVISLEDGNYSNYDFISWCQISQLKRELGSQKEDWISTVRFYIAAPRILRLISYDQLPRHKIKFNRRNLFARDQNKCQYCGEKFPTSELSLDHVIPRSMGGATNWENVVCSCTRCNNKKGGRTPKQALMNLISKPARPRHHPLLQFHLGHRRYHSWKQFLDNAYWSVELK